MHPVVQAAFPQLLEAKVVLQDKYMKTASFTMFYAPSVDASPSTADVLAWANAYHVAVGGELDDIIDHETNIMFTHARWYKYPAIELEAFSDEASIAGSMGTVLDDGGDEIESLPPTDALIIRKVTGYTGRQNRGRLFIPFISEQVQHDGYVDALNQGGVKDFVATLFTPPNLATFQMVPMHWNRKEMSLVEITSMLGMKSLGTRRDRRRKELNIPIS